MTGNYPSPYVSQDPRFRSPQLVVEQELSSILHRPKEAETEPSGKYQRRSARLKQQRNEMRHTHSRSADLNND